MTKLNMMLLNKKNFSVFNIIEARSE
jgi:hypothetical protein